MDEVFTLNDQETSDHSEFGIADDKHSMVTDYSNNGTIIILILGTIFIALPAEITAGKLF